jgi:hypothetical protein
MLKTITHPVTGKTFKMGCRRPVAPCPRLSLKNYLLRTGLPTPPSTIDYSPAAKAELANIYENDALGDCVIAGMGHIEGVLTGNAGNPLMLTTAQITALYSSIGGYVSGDPATDNGCDPETALNWWQQNGLFPGATVSGEFGLPVTAPGQHKIAGAMVADATDQQELMLMSWLFENLGVAMELPDEWVSPMPSGSGFIWKNAGPPVPENGHFVAGCGYDTGGLIIDTWGMLGTLTFAAVARYATPSNGGQVYAVISTDAIAKGKLKAPNGFDWTQLEADFQALKG